MLVIILVILTLALPVFLYGTFYVARGILRGLRSVAWRETSGVITLAKVERYYRGKDLAKEMLHLSYTYTVDGVVREGTRVSFKSYPWFFGNLSKLVAQYPEERPVVVYYDPLKPESAVLEKGTARADAFLLAGLMLLDAGVLLIWIPPVAVLSILGVALLAFLTLLFRVLRQT